MNIQLGRFQIGHAHTHTHTHQIPGQSLLSVRVLFLFGLLVNVKDLNKDPSLFLSLGSGYLQTVSEWKLG